MINPNFEKEEAFRINKKLLDYYTEEFKTEVDNMIECYVHNNIIENLLEEPDTDKAPEKMEEEIIPTMNDDTDFYELSKKIFYEDAKRRLDELDQSIKRVNMTMELMPSVLSTDCNEKNSNSFTRKDIIKDSKEEKNMSMPDTINFYELIDNYDPETFEKTINKFEQAMKIVKPIFDLESNEDLKEKYMILEKEEYSKIAEYTSEIKKETEEVKRKLNISGNRVDFNKVLEYYHIEYINNVTGKYIESVNTIIDKVLDMMNNSKKNEG